MNFFFAILGAFVKWLFQPWKEKKERKTYKEILWGHKHDIDYGDYVFGPVLLGFAVCMAIVLLFTTNC